MFGHQKSDISILHLRYFRLQKLLLETSAELLIYFVSGAGIDLSCLSIVEGKICWDLYIDGLVVSSDGNLLDALGAAIKVLILAFAFVFQPYHLPDADGYC